MRYIPLLRFKGFEKKLSLKSLGSISEISSGGTPDRGNKSYWDGNIPWVTTSLINNSHILNAEEFITHEGLINSSAKLFPPRTILMAMYGQGQTRGRVSILEIEAATNQACAAIILNEENNIDFVFQYLTNKYETIRNLSNEGGQKNLSASIIKTIEIHLPSLEEQTKIATFLSAVDSKITSLERLVSHWQAYKKGIMQQIFTQQFRFKAPNGQDFPEWEPLTIEKVFHCLDNKRKPLNTSERLLIQGVIPYYGANGIVDYISDYIFDEELVLLAEDGGNFDDYKTRPIAQLVKGKCWVNNHAHVLKAKKGFSTTFLFYSLVHKDIRNHINGSSRSKLNKSDMLNIIINVPVIKEQTKIANFLSSIDDKIAHLQQQLTSYRQFKKALLQQMFI